MEKMVKNLYKHFLKYNTVQVAEFREFSTRYFPPTKEELEEPRPSYQSVPTYSRDASAKIDKLLDKLISMDLIVRHHQDHGYMLTPKGVEMGRPWHIKVLLYLEKDVRTVIVALITSLLTVLVTNYISTL